MMIIMIEMITDYDHSGCDDNSHDDNTETMSTQQTRSH